MCIVYKLGDNYCIVFKNFTASIGDLMAANWVYWRRDPGASKRIFATIKSTIANLAAYIVCDIVRKRKFKLPSSNQSILPYLYS